MDLEISILEDVKTFMLCLAYSGQVYSGLLTCSRMYTCGPQILRLG